MKRLSIYLGTLLLSASPAFADVYVKCNAVLTFNNESNNRTVVYKYDSATKRLISSGEQEAFMEPTLRNGRLIFVETMEALNHMHTTNLSLEIDPPGALLLTFFSKNKRGEYVTFARLEGECKASSEAEFKSAVKAAEDAR
jgi:hypothetical protein